MINKKAIMIFVFLAVSKVINADGVITWYQVLFCGEPRIIVHLSASPLFGLSNESFNLCSENGSYISQLEIKSSDHMSINKLLANSGFKVQEVLCMDLSLFIIALYVCNCNLIGNLTTPSSRPP